MAVVTTDHTFQPDGLHLNPQDILNENSSLMGLLSPTIGLFHEIGHADYYLNNKRSMPSLYDARGRLVRLFNGFDNPEEQRNIENIETPVVKFLGEPTRTNHSGLTIVRVTDPTQHAPSRDFD